MLKAKAPDASASPLLWGTNDNWDLGINTHVRDSRADSSYKAACAKRKGEVRKLHVN